LQQGIPRVSLVGGGQDLNWALHVAKWMPEHAGLVKYLDTTETEPQEDRDMVEQLLTSACQLSVLPGRTGFALDGSIRSLARLQLQQCTTAFFTPAMLGALGSCSSLTWLELHGVDSGSVIPAHSAALGTLTSLQVLTINSTAASVLLPASILPATAGMQRLQQLKFGCGVPAAALAHLPPSLTALTVRPHGQRLSTTAQADLTHLSCLRGIEILRSDAALVNCCSITLPAGVTYLATVTPRVYGAGLSNLQALKLDNVRMPAATRLLRLLKRPVLCALELGLGACGVDALPAVFAAVGAATQLLHPVLRGDQFEHDPSMDLPLVQLGGLQISKHLSKLTGLRALHINAHGSGSPSLCTGTLLDCREVGKAR
jgi:hypothetical protein